MQLYLLFSAVNHHPHKEASFHFSVRLGERQLKLHRESKGTREAERLLISAVERASVIPNYPSHYLSFFFRVVRYKNNGKCSLQPVVITAANI